VGGEMTQTLYAHMNKRKNKKKKMWYLLYTMEFYSATKKNEILPFSSKWMELENSILSEVIQAQKVKNRMFSLMCRL
jgi:hypothetical protein